jgi:hypothetical protein
MIHQSRHVEGGRQRAPRSLDAGPEAPKRKDFPTACIYALYCFNLQFIHSYLKLYGCIDYIERQRDIATIVTKLTDHKINLINQNRENT